jgi:hypothetical protein
MPLVTAVAGGWNSLIRLLWLFRFGVIAGGGLPERTAVPLSNRWAM